MLRCTQTHMRARPHTLLTNRYMTPFDPPKISVARVSHFHVISHISCKYINSLYIYFHLHSHFHMTLFALNDLNGSCLTGHGLLCPFLLKLSACLRWLSQSNAMKKVLPLKQSSWGQNLIVCSFINSYIHPFTATLVSYHFPTECHATSYSWYSIQYCVHVKRSTENSSSNNNNNNSNNSYHNHHHLTQLTIS